MSRHGIVFETKQVVSIKNLYKQKDLFAPIARKRMFVATPGTSNPDWSARCRSSACPGQSGRWMTTRWAWMGQGSASGEPCPGRVGWVP